MKHTPALIRALARAEKIPSERYLNPQGTEREEPSSEHARLQDQREQRLKRCAEDFLARERDNEMYRYYLKIGDRTNARYHQPTQLRSSVNQLVLMLLDAARQLADFEEMPIAPHITSTPKRWQKTKRFFALLETERAITRQGEKPRHRTAPTRGRSTLFTPKTHAERQAAPAAEQPTLL